MTTSANLGTIPQWDLADRLTKALHHSGVRVHDMADYLGVSRNTVGNYLNRRTTPDKRTLRLWAMRTGVPLTWLETGNWPGEGPGDGGNEVTRQYPQVQQRVGRPLQHLYPVHSRSFCDILTASQAA